ncbi:MAG: hypothetical protein K2W95_29675 [Candidatus Obscuribacterales bacterium]|nr:hypothetical protein [Candidatus Obscuribacterales bacterium]
MNLNNQSGGTSEVLTLKVISQVHFRLFNLFAKAVPGRCYRVRRSDGCVELWQLLSIDASTGRLVMAQTAEQYSAGHRDSALRVGAPRFVPFLSV